MFGRWPGRESVSTATKELNIDFKKFFSLCFKHKKESQRELNANICKKLFHALSSFEIWCFLKKENNWLIYRLPLLLIGLGTSPAKPASGDLERATWDPVFCNVNRCTVVITSGVCLIVGSC